MTMLARLLPAALLMVGCAQPLPAEPSVPRLAGATWQIVSIDGSALENHPIDGIAREPHFAFGQRSYGGHAGCNGMGGLHAQVGDRLYTMPGPQTEMGCGAATGAQEAAAGAVLSASPTVRAGAAGVVLEGGGHRMELARDGRAPLPDPPTAWQGSGVAGQSFAVLAVNGEPTDGRRVWSDNPPRVRFGRAGVTAKVDCPAPMAGRFVERDGQLEVSGVAARCRAAGTRDAALAAILAGHPRAVSGPNGELLLASPAGWAILENERRDRPK